MSIMQNVLSTGFSLTVHFYPVKLLIQTYLLQPFILAHFPVCSVWRHPSLIKVSGNRNSFPV